MNRILFPAILAFAFLPLSLPAAAAAETLDEAVTHVKVRGVLLEHFGTDALGITIDVRGADVTLSGSVEHANTQELAPQAARDVKGVAKVDNRIQVSAGPATKAKVSTGHAKTSLQNALLEAKVNIGRAHV